tara:strand:+ start:616 stop:1530 length:915 start_codon:yes stop_codon:yes gene_type:complete
MSDLDRIKHLAGLTMESGRGLLHEFKAKGIAPNPFKKRSPPVEIATGPGDKNPFRNLPYTPGDTDEFRKPRKRDPEIKDPGYDPSEYPNWPYDKSKLPKLPKIKDPGYDPSEYPNLPYDKPKYPKEKWIDKLRKIYDAEKDNSRDLRYRMDKRAMNDDINRLKHLAGLDEKMGTGTDVPLGGFPKYKRPPGMGTGTDVPVGGFPKYEKLPGMGTGTDILPPTPDEADEIIKRGKENQIIGKYRPPGSPRDPELDDILRRRAKELEADPLPILGRGIIDNDEIKRRIDRIKGKDDIRQYQFGKLK